MVRSCGGVSSRRDSADRYVSSANGLLAAGGRKRQRRKANDRSLLPGARMLTISRDTLSKSETITVAASEPKLHA